MLRECGLWFCHNLEFIGAFVRLNTVCYSNLKTLGTDIEPTIKVKIYKLDNQNKKFCSPEDTVKPHTGRKYSQNTHMTKNVISKIYKELLQLNKYFFKFNLKIGKTPEQKLHTNICK